MLCCNISYLPKSPLYAWRVACDGVYCAVYMEIPDFCVKNSTYQVQPTNPHPDQTVLLMSTIDLDRLAVVSF